jgi:hypothetical protein
MMLVPSLAPKWLGDKRSTQVFVPKNDNKNILNV